MHMELRGKETGVSAGPAVHPPHPHADKDTLLLAMGAKPNVQRDTETLH